ncbi:Uncharacterised protein [Bordetella pertussis]|nr:Uncharacterised protein [Bordetella pertussis]
MSSTSTLASGMARMALNWGVQAAAASIWPDWNAAGSSGAGTLSTVTSLPAFRPAWSSRLRTSRWALEANVTPTFLPLRSSRRATWLRTIRPSTRPKFSGTPMMAKWREPRDITASAAGAAVTAMSMLPDSRALTRAEVVPNDSQPTSRFSALK